MSESSNRQEAPARPLLLSSHYEDAFTAGVAVQVDPPEADRLGFFRERALSVSDAWASNGDVAGITPDYASTVAAAVLHQLKGGTAPWMLTGAGHLPYNPISGAAYWGPNAVWLAARADALGYSDPRWMTSGQAAAAGAHVRQGEIGTPIHFWQQQGLEPVRGPDGRAVHGEFGNPAGQLVRYETPRLFAAVVFNGDQLEGLPPLTALDLISAEPDPPGERHSNSHFTDPIGSEGRARAELQRNLELFMSGRDQDQHNGSPAAADVTRAWIGLIERDPHEIFRVAAAAEAEIAGAQMMSPARAIEDAQIPPMDAVEVATGFSADASATRMPTLIPRDHPAMAVMEDRTYLAVPYAEKDDAKALGAKWDRQAKAWFVPAGLELDAFQPWLPAMGQVHIAVDSDPRAEFAQALRDAGLRIDGVPQMDGSMQRVPAEGDRGPERSGAYVGHLDGRPAGFIQNFRTGVRMQWKASGPATPLDALDRAQMAAEAAQRRHDRAAEREKQYERVAQEVDTIWTAATPIDAHPYLAAKGVPSHGLRQAEDGRLLIPVQDTAGKVWSLQHVSANGMKHFHPEGRLESGHFVIGDLNRAGPLLIAEGYATAASVHALTNQPTVAAFNAGNLLPVVERYRGLYPERAIYIAGDNDHRLTAIGKANVGAEKAHLAATAVGGIAILPPFEPQESGSDWNDMVHARGLDHAKAQIAVSMAIAERELSLSAFAKSDVERNPGEVSRTQVREAAGFAYAEIEP